KESNTVGTVWQEEFPRICRNFLGRVFSRPHRTHTNPTHRGGTCHTGRARPAVCPVFPISERGRAVARAESDETPGFSFLGLLQAVAMFAVLVWLSLGTLLRSEEA